MKFIASLTIQAIKEIYQVELPENVVTLQETRKEFEGQLTIVTFPFTKFSKKSPELTGAEIGDFLVANSDDITSYNVIKGFLNLKLSDLFWFNLLNESVLDECFGVIPKNGKKVMVEYSSPNTNKPLHLGHVRNNLLGYAVSEILNAAGYDVIKSNLINDRGIHICKSMLAWQKFGEGETPQSSGLKGDKLVGNYYVIFDKEYKKEIGALRQEGYSEEDAKKEAPLMKEAQKMLRDWEAGDQQTLRLWQKMNEWVYEGFEETYRRMGVSFDKVYYESNTYLLGKDLIEEGLKNGVFFRKADNSVWIDLSDEGLDEKLVLRGDGTSVYITQDLGTAQLKFDDCHMDQSIYVVGNEQDYHFKVLFLILKKLGKPWAPGLHHLSYGMVDLPSGKMKSREGTVVDADDLMLDMVQTAKNRTEELGKVEGFTQAEKDHLYEMIGMGALKYFLLKVEPKKRLLFDPNESIDFQGNTGPFIQYTHARIRSVLAKGSYDPSLSKILSSELHNIEIELIISLSKFPETITAAAEDLSPSLVANYIYELAKLYNKFYHEMPILKVEEELLKIFRLNLSAATAGVISKGMRLLGIEVPERM
ncbi:arginine--tRNA ligase [Olivibacter sp. SDN3]|uniref:arginine--tRNA ligase n=1 Tax=Olivibacter sp. SDN3 TaxID=2764720 RepID=UPI001651A9C0|nr:arginine--tRNA ligase [Olivibacter sp. SDN3]QNL49092.1 arginine--tRNA ligase [Olivibacter sp. SDN3]